MYVRMMTPAIDREFPVVIECSWVTQEHHAHLLSPIAKLVFDKYAAQRRILDRLALGCGILSVRALDVSAPLRAEWRINQGVLPTLEVGDWDEYLFTDIADKIKRQVNPGPGVGRWAPGEVILLVGDQHGDTVQPYSVQRNIAFCSMSGKGCSEWLTTQLMKANIPETALYWINAREPKTGSGIHTSWDFAKELKPKAVIALGDMASTWCRCLTDNYIQIQHPQSWKRFHYYEQYPLIPILKELLNGSDGD